MDAVWMNYVAQQQDLNGLFAEALYMAMPAGFCPVHRYWRDNHTDQHEPVKHGEHEVDVLTVLDPRPGMIDCWVGNPFDTVFDPNARKGSVYWCSYGRSLPGALVRAAFGHIPGVMELEGSTKVPSASQFQRIVREWQTEGLGVHGSPVIGPREGHQTNEDSIAVLCREVLPAVEVDWPDGRLQIALVPGSVDFRRGRATAGHALLVVDQPLPAQDFSWTNFYSHHRSDDVHGKPWVEDIDENQVEFNIARSKRWEVINRMAEAPIVAPGGAIADDMADIGAYNILEVEPTLAGWRPRVMEWPSEILAALDKEVESRRQAIYAGGGYQAASRGEAPGSRMAYRAIVALQQADNTIHGPVNLRFRRSACDFARGCWRQMKRYGDVPWLIELSERVPHYKLVNAFGASPELQAQEVLELMTVRGADGQVFLTTEEARRQYPNQRIFDRAGGPQFVARRRAKTVSTAIEYAAEQIRGAWGLYESDPSDPQVQMAAMHVFGLMETKYPRLQDDDLAAHLAALSEITQDETADIVARLAAAQRQKLYYQWQAMMAAQGTGQPQITETAGSAPQRPTMDRRAIAAAGQEGGGGRMLQGAPSQTRTA
jgi:hypothetical protein